MDDAKAWRIERLCEQAWPALEEEEKGGWRLRFAGGFTRRANSANPLSPAAYLTDRTVEDCALPYRMRGLPPIFRIPTLIGPDIDARLASAGYSAEAESIVLFGVRADWSVLVADCAVVLVNTPTPLWLAAAARLRAHGPEETALFARMVMKLEVPAIFAALRHDGAIVATAYAALADDLLCFEAVVTDPAWRGRGFAHRIVSALLGWGAGCGASGACLQVEADNAAARAVYRRAGLTTEMYRYHYRRGQA